MSSDKNNYEDENRKRLQNIVNKTIKSDTPIGWEKSVFAVGGLIEIGF